MGKKTVVHQKNGKYQNVYILGAKLFWAKVHKPTLDEFSGEQKYSATVFVTEEQKDELEALGVNKQIAEVDKTRIKKGKNKGNIKFSSEKYEGTAGMFGFTIDQRAFDNDGNPRTPPIIVSADGKTRLTADIGNGSVVDLRCSAYNPKIDPDMLCLNLNLIKVNELVEYSGGGVVDDMLGIQLESEAPKKAVDSDEPPFDVDVDEDDDFGNDDY